MFQRLKKLTHETPWQDTDEETENPALEENRAPEAQATATKPAVPALSASVKQVSGIVNASLHVSPFCLKRSLDPGTVCRPPPRRPHRRM